MYARPRSCSPLVPYREEYGSYVLRQCSLLNGPALSLRQTWCKRFEREDVVVNFVMRHMMMTLETTWVRDFWTVVHSTPLIGSEQPKLPHRNSVKLIYVLSHAPTTLVLVNTVTVLKLGLEQDLPLRVARTTRPLTISQQPAGRKSLNKQCAVLLCHHFGNREDSVRSW